MLEQDRRKVRNPGGGGGLGSVEEKLFVGKSKPQTSLLLVLVMPTDSISQCIDVYLNCSSFVFSYNVLLSQHISLPLVFECIVATENARSRYTLPWY